MRSIQSKILYAGMSSRQFFRLYMCSKWVIVNIHIYHITANMGKRKQYKADKRDFKKEITQLMKKQAKEEEKKSKKASKVEKLEGVGTSAGASQVEVEIDED